jgi:hypothetical protein
MPDTPGSLHRAAEIIKKYEGNINRVQYDRRIDPATVFYEVTASKEAYTDGHHPSIPVNVCNHYLVFLLYQWLKKVWSSRPVTPKFSSTM